MDALKQHPRLTIAAILGLVIAGTFGIGAGDSMFMAAADSIHRQPLLSGWQHLPTIFSSDFLMFSDGKFRPLSYGLIALVRSVVDADSLLIWHTLFLLIHWANAVLLTRMVRHFAGGILAPLLAGLVFAVHPLASVVVSDAGLLHHLLTPTAYLTLLLFYLHTEIRGWTAGRTALGLGLFALGLLVSKVLFTVPLLLLAHQLLYLRAGWRRALGVVAPFALLGLIVSPLWWWLRPHPLHFSYIVFPPGATWFTMYSVISAVEWYARGLLLGSGIPVVLHEAVPQIYELLNLRLAILSAGVVAVLGAGVLLMRRRQWGGIGLLLMVVAMLPFASTTWNNAHDYVSWKYLYVPLAGLALFFGWLVEYLAGRKLVGALLWLVVPLLAWQQIQLNRAMTSPEAYWSRVRDLNPDSEVAHVELGKVFLARDQPVAARALLFAPAVKELYASASAMCRYYGARGEYLPAAIHLRMALRRGRGLQFGHGEPLTAELMHTVKAYDHAEAALGKVLTSNPYDLSAMERLADIWSTKGFVRAAERLWEQASELDPSSAAAHRMQAALDARNMGGGIPAQIEPPPPGWLRYATQGSPDGETQAQIIALSDRYQDDPIIQLEAAASLARRLDYDGALLRFERVTQTLPNSVFAWAMRAWTAAESGHMDEAIAAGKRAMELDNRNATVHNTLGILAARQAALTPGDESLRELAIEHFRQTLRLDPTHTSAYVNLGKELAHRGDTERAMALYRRAVRLRPDFSEAHYNMGNLAATLGDHAEAIKCYKLALRGKHNYVEAHYNQGLSEAATQNLEGATLCFLKALELRPTFTKARDALATSLMQQGAYRECLLALRQGLKATPGHWQGAIMLATLLTSCPDTSLRDPATAVILARVVSKRFRHQNPDVLLVLANAQAATADVDGAIASARRALSLVDATRHPDQAARAQASLSRLLQRKSREG